MPNKMNRKLFFLLLFIFLGTVLFLGGTFLIEPESVEVNPKQTVKETPQQEEKQQVKIILAGDIMLNRGVEYMVEKEGNGDFKFPFLKIADYLKEADIVFGNLEGVISDKGTNVGSIYSFRVDPKAVEGLNYAGFNVLSLANNHAFDYSKEALEDCLTRLSNEEINYVGAGFSENEAYSPLIKEINSSTGASTELSRMSSPLRIGFLAYTNLGPETWRAAGENSGIAWISENDFEKIKEYIESAKEMSDVLIVSLHAGEEYQRTPSQFQIDFSKMAIDAGADLAVGHHPHVTQPFEKYQNGWIFYSLGNFVFDQSFSEETMESQIIEILIEDNEIKEINPREIKINNFFQPEILK